MSGLRRDGGFGERGDDLYAALVEAHDGLDEARSLALNARLVLLLANHVGDLAVLQEAVAAARASLDLEPASTPLPVEARGRRSRTHDPA